MPSTIPCLWYDQSAEEAAQFYCSIFPNSSVLRVERSPMDNPSGPEGSVLPSSSNSTARAIPP